MNSGSNPAQRGNHQPKGDEFGSEELVGADHGKPSALHLLAIASIDAIRPAEILSVMLRTSRDHARP